MSKRSRIIIAGAGGIGRAAALILREAGHLNADIFLGDLYPAVAQEAAAWVTEGSRAQGQVEAFALPETDQGLETYFKGADIILDCAPGAQAPRLATLARKYGLHYANLTEYVAETNRIMEIAAGADTGFVLQTGLAPGYINVLANGLWKQFQHLYGVKKLERMSMRVGALTHNARAPHYYGFTWSPIGVATEYVKPAVVIRNGVKTELPSLSERETLLIDGRIYEEDLTSGGAADLPESMQGICNTLDYKTLRYPGHYAWVDAQLAEIGDAPDRIDQLENRMLAMVPSLEDDVVVIYAAVEGFDATGRLRSLDASAHIPPTRVGARTLRAIQSTTAAPLCESCAMLLSGQYKGVVLQSQLDPETFLRGSFVRPVYGDLLHSI